MPADVASADGRAAVWERLHGACSGVGTDEDRVWRGLGSVKAQGDWRDVCAAFRQQYPDAKGGDLRRWLASDLTDAELAKAKGILKGNGVDWDGGGGGRHRHDRDRGRRDERRDEERRRRRRRRRRRARSWLEQGYAAFYRHAARDAARAAARDQPAAYRRLLRDHPRAPPADAEWLRHNAATDA
eukprot:gene39419-12223_t